MSLTDDQSPLDIFPYSHLPIILWFTLLILSTNNIFFNITTLIDQSSLGLLDCALTNHLLGCFTTHRPIFSWLAWPRIDKSSLGFHGNSNCDLSVCAKLFQVILYSQTYLTNSRLSSLCNVTPTINKTSIQCSSCLTLLAVPELPVGSMYAADGFYDKGGKSWVPTHL